MPRAFLRCLENVADAKSAPRCHKRPSQQKTTHTPRQNVGFVSQIPNKSNFHISSPQLSLLRSCGTQWTQCRGVGEAFGSHWCDVGGANGKVLASFLSLFLCFWDDRKNLLSFNKTCMKHLFFFPIPLLSILRFGAPKLQNPRRNCLGNKEPFLHRFCASPRCGECP